MQTKVKPNYFSYGNSETVLYVPVKLCHRKYQHFYSFGFISFAKVNYFIKKKKNKIIPAAIFQ